MIANIETKFQCNYETVVQYVKRPITLDYIAFPILVFKNIDPKNYPKIWKNGTYQVKMMLFNFIPFGKQYIKIEELKDKDPNEFIIRDNGTGDLIKKWDHWIIIKKINGNSEVVQYIDRIDIDAGLITSFIWIFANIFYRWRQFRWKSLINNSFKQLED